MRSPCRARGRGRCTSFGVMTTTLSPGDKAPAFTLLDQDEQKVKLTDFKGRKVLV